MSGVDLSKIKPGDEVTVRLTVGSAGLGNGCLRWHRFLNSASEPLRVHETSIVSHTPKALSVGDRVKVPGYKGRTFDIRAIDEGFAWLRDSDSDGSHIQWTLCDLERV